MSYIKPLVAVRILTYNHEKYISQAIDSVLAQKTNFPFTIIIGEDCSTDSTAKICQTYSEKYPLLIKLICNPINDIQRNSLNNFEACFKSGAKYIALLEGDDYWTDPLKLQKQVDFLENNPDYPIISSNTLIVNQNNHITEKTSYSKIDITIEDMLEYNFIGRSTASILFKSNCLNNDKILPILKLSFGDWPIIIQCLKYGKGRILEEVTAAYRIQENGVWNSLNETNRIKSFLEIYDYLIDELHDFRDEIKEKRLKYITYHIKEAELRASKRERTRDQNEQGIVYFFQKARKRISKLFNNR